MTDFVPPTPEELEHVAQLRTRLATEYATDIEGFTDTKILRFYRGRKQDLEKSYKALVKHIEWNKEFDVSNVNSDQYGNENDKGKVIVDGYDSNGRPCVAIFAKHHLKNPDNLERLRYLIIRTLEDALKKAKPEEERIVICFDLTGFTFANMDYDALKILINILAFNYPETLSVAYVINPPFIFSACWAVIRPWLDPVTAAKAVFIKKDQLPTHFKNGTIPRGL